jgi:hypothetical protein
LRRAVERRSAFVIVFLRGLPRWLPGILVVGLLAGGLLLHGVPGAVLLAVIALLLIWLVFLSWPALPVLGRGVRLVVIALLIAAVIGRALGRF